MSFPYMSFHSWLFIVYRINQHFPPTRIHSMPPYLCPNLLLLSTLMSIFLQPTKQSFPRNAMNQACLHICVHVPAIENTASPSMPTPHFYFSLNLFLLSPHQMVSFSLESSKFLGEVSRGSTPPCASWLFL